MKLDRLALPVRLRPWMLGGMAIAALPAIAATVISDPHPTYRRISFAFPAAAQMKVSHAGTRVTLNFNQVLGLHPADVRAQLGEYATAVTESSDGKTLVITLKDDANVRQFSNGKTVGIDIVADDPNAPKTKDDAAKNSPFKHAQTREPVSAKAIASTVKAAPVASVEQSGAASTPAPEKTAPSAADVNSKPAPNLLITTHLTKDGTVINFPWDQRTATAIYEQPRTIWIIFSHEADAHVAQLNTIMPKQVVRVQQFAYPGALVLRLTTDGTVHATTSQSGTNYEWNVTLGVNVPQAALDTPVGPDNTGDKSSLLFGVFDTAAPLQFFDPVTQERMLVAPTFETSRGVVRTYNYPELTVLQTQQGIAVLSSRNDVTMEATRQGVKVRAPTSLSISPSLPLLSARDQPIHASVAVGNIMMPYDQWYIAPRDFFPERAARLAALAQANQDTAPTAVFNLMALYLGSGFLPEAYAYTQVIHAQYPEYYVQHKLALISAACNVYMGRLPEAQTDIAAKELDGMEEATMWREIIALLTPPTIQSAATTTAAAQSAAGTQKPPTPGTAPAPAPAPADDTQVHLDFVKYNKQFIHYYPPSLRQRLIETLADSDAYQNRENAVLAMYSTLATDGILPPAIDAQVQIQLAQLAAKKGRTPAALEILDKVASESPNMRAQIQAQYIAAMLRYNAGQIDAPTTIEILSRLTLDWRGDRLERDMLIQLGQIEMNNKQYGDALRTWKTTLETFPSDPTVLKLSADTSELFEDLFLKGGADAMQPLESLATFYEFRELTPVGDRGDLMIQKLADRLAAVDLIDRAIQLLQTQIKFRLSGEARARVGARLAILQLVNQQPQDALSTIETTNFTGSPPDLQLQRAEIAAKALAASNRTEEALSIIANDRRADASLLRLDIFWSTKDWPNVINQGEDILGSRPNLTAPLNPMETDVLLKLVLGYTFENDHTQLKYLRDYYSGLIADSGYKQIFDYLTNDTHPLDTEDFAMVAQQISHSQAFMGNFQSKIAQGKLSETIR